MGQNRKKHRINSHLINLFSSSEGVSKASSASSASKHANGRASGPVPKFVFLVILAHSASSFCNRVIFHSSSPYLVCGAVRWPHIPSAITTLIKPRWRVAWPAPTSLCWRRGVNKRNEECTELLLHVPWPIWTRTLRTPRGKWLAMQHFLQYIHSLLSVPIFLNHHSTYDISSPALHSLSSSFHFSLAFYNSFYSLKEFLSVFSLFVLSFFFASPLAQRFHPKAIHHTSTHDFSSLFFKNRPLRSSRTLTHTYIENRQTSGVWAWGVQIWLGWL